MRAVDAQYDWILNNEMIRGPLAPDVSIFFFNFSHIYYLYDIEQSIVTLHAYRTMTLGGEIMKKQQNRVGKYRRILTTAKEVILYDSYDEWEYIQAEGWERYIKALRRAAVCIACAEGCGEDFQDYFDRYFCYARTASLMRIEDAE